MTCNDNILYFMSHFLVPHTEQFDESQGMQINMISFEVSICLHDHRRPCIMHDPKMTLNQITRNAFFSIDHLNL